MKTRLILQHQHLMNSIIQPFESMCDVRCVLLYLLATCGSATCWSDLETAQLFLLHLFHEVYVCMYFYDRWGLGLVGAAMRILH